MVQRYRPVVGGKFGVPFLNIEITSVILNKSGYSPSTIHLLYSVHRNCAITDLPYLMNFVGASTLIQALFIFN